MNDRAENIEKLKVLALDILTEFSLTESIFLNRGDRELCEEAVRSVHESLKNIDRMLVECDPLIDAEPELFMRSNTTCYPVASEEWAEPIAVAIQVGMLFCARCHGRSVHDVYENYDSPVTAPPDVYIRAVARVKAPGKPEAVESSVGSLVRFAKNIKPGVVVVNVGSGGATYSKDDEKPGGARHQALMECVHKHAGKGVSLKRGMQAAIEKDGFHPWGGTALSGWYRAYRNTPPSV